MGSRSAPWVAPAGNRKLDRKRARGSIDGLVALTMALAVAATEELPREPEFQMIILSPRR